MSRAGECLDNAMAERCFATRTAERVAAHQWPPRAAAPTAIVAWVAVFSPRQRAHAALAYQPPVTFEEDLVLLAARAAERYPVRVSQVTPPGPKLATGSRHQTQPGLVTRGSPSR